MGDRANVFVIDEFSTKKPDQPEPGGVYLYTHWGGSELPEAVRVALAKRWRWDDSAYLTRIIFDQMTAGDQGSETGFGIGLHMPDNDGYPIIMIDTGKKEVRFMPCNWVKDRHVFGTTPAKVYTFEEYIAQDHAEWPDLDDEAAVA